MYIDKKIWNNSVNSFLFFFFHVTPKTMKNRNQWSASALLPIKIHFPCRFCWSLIMHKFVKFFKLLVLINQICRLEKRKLPEKKKLPQIDVFFFRLFSGFPNKTKKNKIFSGDFIFTKIILIQAPPRGIEERNREPGGGLYLSYWGSRFFFMGPRSWPPPIFFES